MRKEKSSMRRPTLAIILTGALGISAGCGPDNPKIAEAPPYQPPPTTAGPPQVKGADGAYTYGSNPDYQNAMNKASAATGGGR
jgi:hypothetical protein